MSDEIHTIGTVVSVGKGSLLLRADDGSYTVYAVTRNTVHAQPLVANARVRVVTLTGDTNAVAPTAVQVDTLPKPQGLAESAAEEADPVPQSVRRMESQIQKAAQKYHLGVIGGVGLDPEIISLNAFGAMGPFFTGNFQFRPGLEFAFGEATTLFGIHLDAIYRAPAMARSTNWTPYFGAGPSFSFSHRGFEAERVTDEDQVERFDFGDFSWNNGLNLIFGMRSQSGKFLELKATPWGISTVRLLGGFEF